MRINFNSVTHLDDDSAKTCFEITDRLAQFRCRFPDAQLSTTLVRLEGGRAVVRAEILLPGGARATGWGSCGSDTQDFVEIAESTAIGTALDGIGFDTRSSFGDDNLNEKGQTLQAVVSEQKSPVNNAPDVQRSGATISSLTEPATRRQLSFLSAVARDKGMSSKDLDSEAFNRFGTMKIDLIDRREASELIRVIQRGAPVAIAS